MTTTMTMTKERKAEIVLDTLKRVNDALKSNPNALVRTTHGEINPEAAYIELVASVVALAK